MKELGALDLNCGQRTLLHTLLLLLIGVACMVRLVYAASTNASTPRMTQMNSSRKQKHLVHVIPVVDNYGVAHPAGETLYCLLQRG